MEVRIYQISESKLKSNHWKDYQIEYTKPCIKFGAELLGMNFQYERIEHNFSYNFLDESIIREIFLGYEVVIRGLPSDARVFNVLKSLMCKDLFVVVGNRGDATYMFTVVISDFPFNLHTNSIRFQSKPIKKCLVEVKTKSVLLPNKEFATINAK